MKRAQHLFFAAEDRRLFLKRLGRLPLCAIAAKLTFGAERNMANSHQEYVIINGWVLTRQEFAAGEIASHAV